MGKFKLNTLVFTEQDTINKSGIIASDISPISQLSYHLMHQRQVHRTFLRLNI